MVDSIRQTNVEILLIGVLYYSTRTALGFPKDHPLYAKIAVR